jgi:hypothetical protein
MEFTDPWRARSGTSTAKPGQGCIQTDEGRLICIKLVGLSVMAANNWANKGQSQPCTAT